MANDAQAKAKDRLNALRSRALPHLTSPDLTAFDTFISAISRNTQARIEEAINIAIGGAVALNHPAASSAINVTGGAASPFRWLIGSEHRFHPLEPTRLAAGLGAACTVKKTVQRLKQFVLEFGTRYALFDDILRDIQAAHQQNGFTGFITAGSIDTAQKQLETKQRKTRAGVEKDTIEQREQETEHNDAAAVQESDDFEDIDDFDGPDDIEDEDHDQISQLQLHTGAEKSAANSPAVLDTQDLLDERGTRDISDDSTISTATTAEASTAAHPAPAAGSAPTADTAPIPSTAAADDYTTTVGSVESAATAGSPPADNAASNRSQNPAETSSESDTEDDTMFELTTNDDMPRRRCKRPRTDHTDNPNATGNQAGLNGPGWAISGVVPDATARELILDYLMPKDHGRIKVFEQQHTGQLQLKDYKPNEPPTKVLLLPHTGVDQSQTESSFAPGSYVFIDVTGKKATLFEPADQKFDPLEELMMKASAIIPHLQDFDVQELGVKGITRPDCEVAMVVYAVFSLHDQESPPIKAWTCFRRWLASIYQPPAGPIDPLLVAGSANNHALLKAPDRIEKELQSCRLLLQSMVSLRISICQSKPSTTNIEDMQHAVTSRAFASAASAVAPDLKRAEKSREGLLRMMEVLLEDEAAIEEFRKTCGLSTAQ